MEQAVKYAPFPKEFPVAKDPPIWTSHTLQYAMTGGYYSSSSGSSATQDTTPSSNDGNQGFVQVPDNGPP
jgi:hypothetical protein